MMRGCRIGRRNKMKTSAYFFECTVTEKRIYWTIKKTGAFCPVKIRKRRLKNGSQFCLL